MQRPNRGLLCAAGVASFLCCGTALAASGTALGFLESGDNTFRFDTAGGFLSNGGLLSQENVNGGYDNSFWFFPDMSMSGLDNDAVYEYLEAVGNHSYSRDTDGNVHYQASHYSSGTLFTTDYYLQNNGTTLYGLQYSFAPYVPNGSSNTTDYSYWSDMWSSPPVPQYSYSYVNSEGERIESLDPFDTAAIFEAAQKLFPTSGYSILDFTNSYVTYAGSSDLVSLAQIMGDANYFYFNGGAVDALTWTSDRQITGVSLAWTVEPLSSIPEPETWAMLLAGLGIVGGFASRRARSA